MRGLDAQVAAVLDRRLLAASRRPIALGLSGGGDSLALLLMANAWAQAHGRRLLVLTVDHHLNPQSAAWTKACAAHAGRLGAGFQALDWTGPKPATGLPAAARAARHRLLAEAARGAGARVLLLGHTADDGLEAQAMRKAGSTTPDPREWAPSPAWPQGRGLFVLRPMLAARRAALRAWLSRRGETWIEDPANADPRFARARARAELDIAGDYYGPGENALVLAESLRPVPGGGFEAPLAALHAAGADERRRLLALACVCAGGGRPPRAAAAARLATQLFGTLAGARLVVEGERALIVRDAGEAARGGLAPLALPAAPVVWDGRFEISAAGEGLQVRRLAGLSTRLPAGQTRALAALPAAARGALPAIVEAAGGVTCPLLGDSPARALDLTWARLRAAAGLVAREPA